MIIFNTSLTTIAVEHGTDIWVDGAPLPRKQCWPVLPWQSVHSDKARKGLVNQSVQKNHKVHTYKEYHSVCPLVGIGTLPTALSPASVPLPPEPGGGGGVTRPYGGGVGGVPITTTGEKA